MAKKGLMGGAAIARMNFVDTDLDDSDEEYANLSMVGSRGSHFKSVKVGKGALVNASLNRPDTPEDGPFGSAARGGRGSGISVSRAQRGIIDNNHFSFDGSNDGFNMGDAVQQPPAQGTGIAGIRARKAVTTFDFGDEEQPTDIYGNPISETGIDENISISGTGSSAARALQEQKQPLQEQQQPVQQQLPQKRYQQRQEEKTQQTLHQQQVQPQQSPQIQSQYFDKMQDQAEFQQHQPQKVYHTSVDHSSMAPTVEGIASDGTNAMGQQNAVDLREKLNAEERQLAEMEDLHAKQADLAARRAKLERARFEAEAALTEARMQNEAAQIALLEQETQALTQKRMQLQALKNSEMNAFGGAGLMGISATPPITEGIVMPSMIEQPIAKAPALMSKRSLYDMMGAEAASNAAAQVGVTKGIYPLSEAEQEATDIEDERDPVTGRGAASSRREVPTLHTAAGEGRTADVHAFLSADPALAHSVDSVNRNALFYACVNGHVEVVQLLMSRAAESCLVADTNGDTALHAAVSAGSGSCARALLQAAPQNICEVENVLGMRPAHLAKDRECIELLATAGAILNAEDKQLRVPLFVACAMDRVEVAQYLCEILQSSAEELIHVDRRGDTPMHAAACNGSIRCVQMFLDLGGLSLHTRNKKGYRPVDLAARRGHADCERIIIGFANQAKSGGNDNSGYFDNILFQATVQGQQMCEEALEADGEYEIIRHSNPQATEDELRRMHSMWSSRRAKSMRLKQYGNWIAYEDKVLKTVFWYNGSTQESQWDKPDEVTAIQNAKLAEAKGEWEALRKTSMRLKRIGDWIEYHGNGKTFYYKESTGEFMYERPLEMMEEAKVSQTDGNIHKTWAPYKDPNTGMRFWYCAATGESQWATPKGYEDAESDSAPVWDENDGNDHHEAHEIHDLDELGI